MSITHEQFDRALAEFQQFGLRRRIPVEERWRESLPELPAEELTALRARCDAIESRALSLAVQVRDGRLSDASARDQLAQSYPTLTDERLARTWSQAMYFAMRE
jgi:hypothetical protein